MSICQYLRGRTVLPCGGTTPVSDANQSAACGRMSRSIFSCRFSRLSPRIPAALGRGQPLMTHTRIAISCATRLLIVCPVGSELAREFLRRASGFHRLDHVRPKFHRVWCAM